MVDVVEGQDANEQSGPSEETKAEQRRTAKERQRRIEATKAQLDASEVRARLDSNDRLLKDVLKFQDEGDTEKVQGAIRDHDERAVAIKSQVEYKSQMDDLLLEADMEWDDEEVTSSDFSTKWEAGDLVGALREVQKVAGPTAVSAEDQVTQIESGVRSALAKMGVQIDEGSVNIAPTTQSVSMQDLADNPQRGKEAFSTILDDFYKKVKEE